MDNIFNVTELGGVENIILQSYEEGLSASWITEEPNSKVQRVLSELLNLPDNVKAYSIIAIGYSTKNVDIEAIDCFDEARIHYNKY